MAKDRHVIVDDFGKHQVLRRRDFMEVSWGLPQAGEVGFVRGLSRGLQASTGSVSWVTLPFGQGTPVHGNTAEHVIVALEGQVEFRLGGEAIELAPMDSLFIPANYMYSYHNVGPDLVRFFSILFMYDVWPAAGIYND